ncbi:MAG: imidazolonepropionase [Cytophagales bacterium]|nr:imidazolonepropionase [Cytophagales bacterium]
MNDIRIIGPFAQMITMNGLPSKGPVSDDELEIIHRGGLAIKHDRVFKVGKFRDLRKEHASAPCIETEQDTVALPGFIDPHTHICYAGSRANDYAMRIAGKSYLEIAQDGGGIWQTVRQVRAARPKNLLEGILTRAESMLRNGVTTSEVKSGYGLTPESELKMLETVKLANKCSAVDLVPTCLAAHITPKDFDGDSGAYLEFMAQTLFTRLKAEKLSNRVDIFIEEGAFKAAEAISYLQRAKENGFELTVHGDQFTTSGSRVAIEVGAVSVDHLEASKPQEIEALARSRVTATVLPGASLGLGMQFAPARKLLDAGCALAIGSDWNPGSAPMGDLLVQASILGASEKLSNAETFAGITCRSAKALNLVDRGTLAENYLADLVGFPTNDYREILYHQGMLKPNLVLKKGNKVY